MSRRHGRDPTPVQEVDPAVFAQYADISELVTTGLPRLYALRCCTCSGSTLRPAPALPSSCDLRAAQVGARRSRSDAMRHRRYHRKPSMTMPMLRSTLFSCCLLARADKPDCL